jgi:hypothetical protein
MVGKLVPEATRIGVIRPAVAIEDFPGTDPKNAFYTPLPVEAAFLDFRWQANFPSDHRGIWENEGEAFVGQMRDAGRAG